ncbi:polysaccharide deacetylase [Cochleicola gelatinilyticus]|uniref:Polysaccharide deacetylase n=2 Tax=Cochleicola gelatinilyticus TaxID=1763537 RepID=A0A167JGS3_9FLAO|nr:polysaccharide deacetylase [Cochleicola gelatinilyticus]
MFPKRIWALPSKDTVYLTFDDGPIPEITPWVLDILKQYGAKATFFCIGDNIEKHPEIFKRIISEGHKTGNHTYHHLNGWKTTTEAYIDTVERCEEVMISNKYEVVSEVVQNKKITEIIEKNFRPPYGKISSRQAKILHKKNFRIIMWSLLSYDYDASVSEEKCLQNVLNHIQPGSIVVFHDSLKASRNLRHTLPKVLDYISEKEWQCSTV